MTPITVGFIANRLSIRGTETVLWGFAHYNEVTLGNKSIIFVKNRKDALIEPHHKDDNTPEAVEWFTNRFGEVHYCPTDTLEDLMIEKGVDVCFIELAGVREDWVPSRVPSVLHCVFQPLQKGTVSTAVSQNVSRGLIPILPNILLMDDTQDDMRAELEIPKDAIVFGRYGGYNQWTIKFAKEAVQDVASKNPDIYFVFMNTCPFTEPAKNIIYLSGTRDLYKKRRYINTCDAMLHGGEDGETFGAAVGEFAICDKNIITCKYQIGPYQDQHIRILGDQCVTYDNYYHLMDILENYPKYKKEMPNNGYYQYTPDKVVPLFNQFIEQALQIANVKK